MSRIVPHDVFLHASVRESSEAVTQYRAYNEKRKRDVARTQCESHGGRLATIRNSADKTQAERAMSDKKQKYWAGLWYDPTTKTYRWADGTATDKDDQNLMDIIEEVDDDEKERRCFNMKRGKKLEEDDCDHSHYFLCDFPSSPSGNSTRKARRSHAVRAFAHWVKPHGTSCAFAHWVKPPGTSRAFAHLVKPHRTSRAFAHWVKLHRTSCAFAHWVKLHRTSRAFVHWVEPYGTLRCLHSGESNREAAGKMLIEPVQQELYTLGVCVVPV